ncbi:PEGA domain-containing protein [Patescibacteria group bacterium]|nr:PEGA domain-containing protein [Patescibacteria group bacterium]MCL5091651.1 PEGA domain-containing protein [Patescibacteria group bacterium]
MKGKLILLFVLLLLFAGFVAARFLWLNNKQNELGQLRITASPEASVFMDNVAIGKTAFDSQYKVGEYLLKLIPEGTATETASWQGKIKIYKNTLTVVNMELGSSDVTSAGEIFTATKMKQPPKNSNYGEVMVETDPQGAIVYLDNDEKGVAPVVLSDVTRGDHELSVFMPGFFRRTQKVNVTAGYQVSAKFKLAIDPSQMPKVAETNAGDKTASASAGSSSSSSSAAAGSTTIVIKDTPTGFLRVRAEPSVEASEEAQVKPGDKFTLLDEQSGWYQIKYDGKNTGWISGQYAEKQ